MSIIIIAEAGVNHNGDISLAKKMIETAAESGADIIKFQTFVPELVVSKYATKADYQKQTTGSHESQLEMVRRNYLNNDEHYELISHAKECNIEFLSTPFDLESIDFLNKLNLPQWKIPSGEITNLPYLIKIAKTQKPVIMSTGMSDLKEVGEAVDILRQYGAGKLTLLHCNTEYPTPYEDVNLYAMLTLKKEFGVEVGYSDHTLGIEVPIAATAMGAAMIEKHFTLDKNMEGPDHKASLEPYELANMVKAIRNTEAALGNEIKIPSPSEQKNIDIARKSIIAATTIRCGETFTESNITTKRPGNGISPMRWFDVLGKTATRDFEEDELIELLYR